MKPSILQHEDSALFAVAHEVVCEALINAPSERVVGDVMRVADAMGSTLFDDIAWQDGLEQRYYDRFFVPTSSLFIPLDECRVASAEVERGRVSWGPAADRCSEHAARCYRLAAFDYRSLKGDALAIGRLRPDSLACEVAYLAFLERGSLQREDAPNTCDRFALAFLSRHAKWVTKAARIMERQGDDFYARLVRFAAEAAYADRERLAGL